MRHGSGRDREINIVAMLNMHNANIHVHVHVEYIMLLSLPLKIYMYTELLELNYPVHVGMSASVKPDSEVRVCRVMVVRLVRVGKGSGGVAWGHTVHLAQRVRLNTYITK